MFNVTQYSDFYKTDQTEMITKTVNQIYQDFDIMGNGRLTVEEFKLMALKEPMIVDFVEEFLRIPEAAKEFSSTGANRARRKSLLDTY